MLNAPREMLIEKADLEEDTVDDVPRLLRAEFENEEPKPDTPQPAPAEQLTEEAAEETAEEMPQPDNEEKEAAEEKS